MPHPASQDSHLASGLDDRVNALVDGISGTVSVWYGGADGRCRYDRLSAQTHYAASTMKLPLLVAAHRRDDRGEVGLDAKVLVHNCFASAHDGSRFSLEQGEDQDDETWARLGATVPLRLLVRHAIVRSGNLATNLVLEQVGTDEVTAVLRDARCSPATVLPRGIEDTAARAAGLDNRVTAGDLALLMCGIASRSLASEDACREMESVLAAQEHRDGIPAGLPPGTRVMNKTGWVDGVSHDVALVRPHDAEPYVLVVCTSTGLAEDDGSRLVAAISRAVWQERVG